MSADYLVVGPSWVGDMVMAQSLFLFLKQRHPDRHIDVLAPDWSQPLLTRMPEVRHALSLPVGHGTLGLGIRYRTGRRLRGRYGQAIVLPNSFKSALPPFHANIAIRTGFLGELRWGLLSDIRPLDKRRLPRTVDRFLALGREPGEAWPPHQAAPEPLPPPRLTVAPAKAAATWEKLGLPPVSSPLLALCPGAEYGPAKCWPPGHFADLAATMASRGWHVVICGSPKEAALGAEIADQAGPQCVNLAGRTTLDEVVEVLSLASSVVSNDSGLMHVATALDRPVVALFGSSDPDHTPPLGPRTRVLTLRLPCAPCFRRHCPEKHLRCLTDISVERVLEQIDPPPPP